MKSRKTDTRLLYPVLAGFFVMGFCDMIAPISARIADEFSHTAQRAVSFLPTMVFLWFLLLSTPIATLMNRIGRKAVAQIGYAFTTIGLTTPYIAGEGTTLTWYFVGFGLLGIGNTAIQVAMNPLLATIVPEERMTSYLTVGQIFRNTSLLLFAPIVTALAATMGSWRLLLPIYAVVTLAAGLWLQFTPVPEPTSTGRSASMTDCFRLLKNPIVAICAFGIGAFIAADVGIGFLSARLLDNPDSILTTTGFYACRIIGTLVGAWLLTRYSDIKYLRWNMIAALLLCGLLTLLHHDAAVYALVGMLGFAMACVFATFYAVATRSEPTRTNEVAGLMILMISAGALSGPATGALVRLGGDVRWGLLFVAICLMYLVWAAFKLKTNNK